MKENKILWVIEESWDKGEHWGFYTIEETKDLANEWVRFWNNNSNVMMPNVVDAIYRVVKFIKAKK